MRYLKIILFIFLLYQNSSSINCIVAQSLNLFNSNLKTLSSPDSLNIRTVGRWAGGPCFSVDAKNSIAYFGNGAFLHTVNFSELSEPQEINQILLQGRVNDVVVNGDYVYVGTCGGFNIVDISAPNDPKLIKSVTPIDCHGLMIRDNYAYIADYGGQGGPAGLKIFDITVPEDANPIGTFPTETMNHNVYVHENFAFLANDAYGLQIIDVSQPNNPIFISNIPSKNVTQGVAVQGQYVFIADGTAGLRIFDISNISEPEEIKQLFLGVDSEKTLNVKIQDGYAFITYSWDSAGLAKYDISDQTNPQLIYHYTTGRSAFDISVQGDTLYVACHSALQVIDFSYLNNPIQYIYETGGQPWDVTVEGNHAILSNLQIIDVSNPENPFKISESTPIGWGWCINIKNNYAYVGLDNSLEIVDISNLTRPKSIRSVSIPGSCRNVVIDGKYAYVAAGNAGLWILDISSPLAPLTLDSCKTGEEAYGIFVKDNLAFVADNVAGLYVIDVSDPNNLNILKHYYNGWGALDLTFIGNYAYVIADNYMLYVIDITDPVDPIERGSYYIGWNRGMADLKVKDNYLYISGLSIFNISNPLYPFEVGHYTTWDGLMGLCIQDNYIYTVMHCAGFYIFEYLRNPQLDVNFTDVYFGNVKIGEYKDTSLEISSPNLDIDTLRISSLNLVSDVFMLPFSETSLKLAPGESHDLNIRYMPTELGNHTGELIIDNNSSNGNIHIDLNGICVDQTLSVLPNPFTPNGDGFNDFVEFEYPGMFTKTSEIMIFDVSGKKIITLDNSNGNNYKWYGIDDRGDPLEPGVYIYIIKVNGDNISNGTITLMR